MTLKLIKPISVVGVNHTRRGIGRTVGYLHNREPVQTVEKMPDTGAIMVNMVGPETDFDAPSKCRGMKVGLELGEDELEFLRRTVREQRQVTDYWEAMKIVGELRLKGKHEEATKLELKALEDYIGGREHHMASRINETGTQVNLVGRAHSDEIVKLLTEVHELTAFAESTADAMAELSILMEAAKYGNARTNYLLREATA
ncbi:hypothetical protein HZC08_00830 [Candidatus Micrarchaeota archaeon]|nr:hypothetical protein [Candidatus Micrarchaeota archaeon]